MRVFTFAALLNINGGQFYQGKKLLQYRPLAFRRFNVRYIHIRVIDITYFHVVLYLCG